MAKRKDFDTKISGALGNMGNTKETVKEVNTVEKEKRMAELRERSKLAKKKAQEALVLLDSNSNKKEAKMNKKKERFTIMLHPDMKKRLKRMTADSDKFISFSDAIAEALDKHLTEKGF